MHGLCSSHGIMAKFASKWEWMIPEAHRRPRCTIEDCGEPSYSNETGLCRNHQAKHKLGTLYIDWEKLRYQQEMEEPGDETTVAGRVKNERINQGLTRAALAARMGLKEISVYFAERGSLTGCTAPAVARYAHALGVPTEALYPDDAGFPGPHEIRDGAKLRRLRLMKGVSLRDMGILLGCSGERVRQLEQMETFSASVKKRVLDALESEEWELMGV
jgi:transcriptional regulator with XRE-family HTH domain